jgi:FkbM family methyltransferase
VRDLACVFRANPPTTILDVGANVGFMSWQLAKTFPQATVFALEPDPAAFHVLQKTHGTNPRIRAFPLAAADRDGELSFVQRGLSNNSSLLAVDGRPDGDALKTIKIEATTLDRFCTDHGIGHIDLLKTDTEGADLIALRGAQGLFARGCIDVVMSEVLFVPTYQGQPTFDEIAGFLKGFGFRIFNIYIAQETRNGQACYGNAVFINRNIHDVGTSAFSG